MFSSSHSCYPLQQGISIPTLASKVRQIYAQIALGEKADKNPEKNLHDREVSSAMEVDIFNPGFTYGSYSIWSKT